MTICLDESCERQVLARGLCRSHYGKARYAGTLNAFAKRGRGLTPEQRFIALIDKSPDGCWNWRGGKVGKAQTYGGFSLNYRSVLAHRFAYEMWRGPIPGGLVIDHLCRNPGCVNPEHLEAVTQRTNLERSTNPVAQAMTATHCKHGHEFTEENTYRAPKTGNRNCRSCRRVSSRKAAETHVGRA